MTISASPSDARDLLVKLCGMLGSDFEGERAVAALKVTTMLRQIGWSWDDVLHPPGGAPRHEAAAPPVREASDRPERPSWQHYAGGFADWRADLACCKRYEILLTAVERAFVCDLTDTLARGRAGLRSSDHVRLASIARRIRRQFSTDAFRARAEAQA
jgi:hypothetical protein